MSRIGKLPISIPAGVTVTVSPENVVTVKGPKGTLTRKFSPLMDIAVEDGVLTVGMECAYAPYNWTQTDDSNGAVPISNVPGAYALQRAKKAGIATEVVVKKELGSHAAFEEKLMEILDGNGIDIIILAGFMTILTEKFTSHYPKRILNVHPSLIPSFCGKGFYGLHV